MEYLRGMPTLLAAGLLFAVLNDTPTTAEIHGKSPAKKVIIHRDKKAHPEAVQLFLAEHQNRVYLKSIDTKGKTDTLFEFQLNYGKLVYDRHGPVFSEDIQKDSLDRVSPNIIGVGEALQK